MAEIDQELLELADAIGFRIENGLFPRQDKNGFYVFEQPCPTCGAIGDQVCIRGRKPNGGAGITGAIWNKQEPFPQGHDSRRSINKGLI